MTKTGPSHLYVGAGLTPLGGVDPTHRSLLVTGSRITWTGDPSHAPAHDEVVDLGHSWLTPGFVDAHVHATATGLQAAGLDLSTCASASDLLAMVADHAASTPHRVVYGAGWDDLTWEGGPPTSRQLAEVSRDKTVVLVRVDGHSCLVDAHTLSRLDLTDVQRHIHRDGNGTPSGWLLEGASAVALEWMRERLSQGHMAAARQAACERAVSLGITTFHEMGIPALSDRDDAGTWATGEWPVSVHVYWAALQVDPTGTLRPGGDLFLDGSIGSCTAATMQPYRTNDGGQTNGELFHSDREVADFFVAATRAGVGAGVHAIGDRAVGQAVAAIQQAAVVLGENAVRSARHRIEHVELVTWEHLADMARLGVFASVQPAFDSAWNGPGGLYEHRFGRRAADDTNPLDWFVQAEVDMCFSSDSTVTPMDPWGGVLAAEDHRGGHRIDRRTALEAATIGGSKAVRTQEQVGALTVGRQADFVAWPGDPMAADPSDWEPVAVVSRGIQRL